MNAGLLFYRAHRTAACESILKRAAERFGMVLSDVRVCVRPEDLNGDISRLLHGNTVVFLPSTAPERRPECAEAIFRTLLVPLSDAGEPKGILRLPGESKTGYLIESVDQAIALFPDEPNEIKKMLPPVLLRLKRKFGLPGGPPEKKRPVDGRLSAEYAGENSRLSGL